jgi:hypothetical protein
MQETNFFLRVSSKERKKEKERKKRKKKGKDEAHQVSQPVR